MSPKSLYRFARGMLFALVVMFSIIGSVSAQDEDGFLNPFGGEKPLSLYLNPNPRIQLDGEIKLDDFVHYFPPAGFPGDDLNNGMGAPIYNRCSDGGTVQAVGIDPFNKGGGTNYFVRIACEGGLAGWEDTFFHMLDQTGNPVVVPGQFVEPGQLIGYQGDHLHLSTFYWGEMKNLPAGCQQWQVADYPGRWWINPAVCMQIESSVLVEPTAKVVQGQVPEVAIVEATVVPETAAVSKTGDFGGFSPLAVKEAQKPASESRKNIFLGVFFLGSVIWILKEKEYSKKIPGLLGIIVCLYFLTTGFAPGREAVEPTEPVASATPVPTATVSAATEMSPQVPLEVIYVKVDLPPIEQRESLEDQQLAQQADCSVFSNFPKEVARWCPYILSHAQEEGMDPKLIASVMTQESGGNPQAYSHSGAVGLMQIMPRDGLAAGFMCAAGPCFAERPSSAELYDPEYNIAYGTAMLYSLLQRHGNIRDALKSYGPMDVGYYYADLVLAIYASH